uniref:Uncharacterized protein n=1 Tax=Knipowitschia caucasica TaxID=637954 RepID=A0AAV2KHA6_KNICA
MARAKLGQGPRVHSPVRLGLLQSAAEEQDVDARAPLESRLTFLETAQWIVPSRGPLFETHRTGIDFVSSGNVGFVVYTTSYGHPPPTDTTSCRHLHLLRTPSSYRHHPPRYHLLQTSPPPTDTTSCRHHHPPTDTIIPTDNHLLQTPPPTDSTSYRQTTSYRTTTPS